MTSLSPSRTQQPSVDGRSVRDIVETSPGQVNEVWCRKIFRQILQSLELQYAMQMPHRAITPDTVVFHENGEPLLVPAQVAEAAPGSPDRSEADDLHALAAIVHYAITREPVPTGPLRGRAPEGYSDSLITAVDRCLAPDPAQRPRHIDELRDILGIVSLGPPVGAQPVSARLGTRGMAAAALPPDVASAPAGAAKGAPAFMPEAPRGRLGAGLSRWQRWSVGIGGAAVLAALALAMFAELRDSGSYDHIVLTLPQNSEHAGGGRPDGDNPLLAGTTAQAPSPASLGANDGGATVAGGRDGLASAPQPQAATDLPAAAQDAPPTAPLVARGALPPPAPAGYAGAPHAGVALAGGASYRLRIQPWGVVYVDGVDRGVSPPVKRLALVPGRHTLRVTNPAFPDRVLEVDTDGGDGVVAVNFNDQAQ